ncbi:hypothetical protein FACS189432_09070 [Bacteroidia bacterium]|nr:hypothetical protein FACS189426_06770 [Bacteroidia bacterium]GHT29833.1 hypothetical protein FACS189432_09070 [Bacteroidia bacterium]
MNDRERIGERIREIRTEKGLSQLQLAELAGLSQQNIARIELGRYSPGIDIVGKISDALGCELAIVSV